MIGRRIKSCRLMRGWSKKALAAKIGVKPQVITSYESGSDMPDLKTARLLASAFDMTLGKLMSSVPSRVRYEHNEFRKQASLTKSCQTAICMRAEEYFDKVILLSEILSDSVLRNPPAIHSLRIKKEPEADAMELRDLLGFARRGPVMNMIGVLENKGILICKMSYERCNFSGLNGFAGERPYIVINSEMTAERQRSTLVHELVHLFFKRLDDININWEKYIEAVSGAFLFPAGDAYDELGERRMFIGSDMVIIARKYGISMQMLMKRASLLGIISSGLYRAFNIEINRQGLKYKEGGRIQPEEPKLLEQLVFRALGEEKITESRAAELLEITLEQLRSKINNELAF